MLTSHDVAIAAVDDMAFVTSLCNLRSVWKLTMTEARSVALTRRESPVWVASTDRTSRNELSHWIKATGLIAHFSKFACWVICREEGWERKEFCLVVEETRETNETAFVERAFQIGEKLSDNSPAWLPICVTVAPLLGCVWYYVYYPGQKILNRHNWEIP